VRQKRKEIKPIEFNLLWSTSINFIPSKILKIFTQELNTEKSETAFHISIDPIKFNFNLNNVKDNWLINLSSLEIPETIKIILQLGQKFNLPNNIMNK